jgi:hypothetical protein
MRFFDSDEAATAAKIETEYEIRLAVLPLTFVGREYGRRECTVRTDALNVHFDNHPYLRKTEYGEVVYLSDHAGRWADKNPTHLTTQTGTRLCDILRKSKIREYGSR